MGRAVKIYDLTPTGRVTIRKIHPQGMVIVPNHQPTDDFKSRNVQTGYEGRFRPQIGDDGVIGRLEYLEVRSPYVSALEKPYEIRIGFMEAGRLFPGQPSSLDESAGFYSKRLDSIISQRPKENHPFLLNSIKPKLRNILPPPESEIFPIENRSPKGIIDKPQDS